MYLVSNGMWVIKKKVSELNRCDLSNTRICYETSMEESRDRNGYDCNVSIDDIWLMVYQFVCCFSSSLPLAPEVHD